MSSRFKGDGRKKVAPLFDFKKEGLKSIAVRKSTARQLCKNFDVCGHSTHSGQGSTVWVILEHCRENLIQYTITGEPGVGFFIQRKEK